MDSYDRGYELTMPRWDAILGGRVVGSTLAFTDVGARLQLRTALPRRVSRDWWRAGAVVRKATR